MVNYRDPIVMLEDFMGVTKFWHTLAGLYIWEFVTTLDYEWDIIQGRRPYRWTIVIYSVTRLAALIDVILFLVVFNINATSYNFQAEVTFQFIFGYLAFAAASLLIVFRIIAIWNKNRYIIAMATSIWLANIGFLIHSLARIRASRVAIVNTCQINVLATKLNTITTCTTDIGLLLIMLVGLIRLGFHETSVFGLGRLMWKQGLVWLFLATITYIPPVVFICLNLNDPLDFMFQYPPMITLSIAATRIYRSLTDYSSRTTDIHSAGSATDKTHAIAFATPKTNLDPAQLISAAEVGQPRIYGQYQTSTSQNTSTVCGEGSSQDKPAVVGLDYDVERSAGSRT